MSSKITQSLPIRESGITVRVLSAAPVIIAILNGVQFAHFPLANAQVNCTSNPSDPSCQQSSGNNNQQQQPCPNGNCPDQQLQQPDREQQFCSDVNSGNFAAATALLHVLGQTSLVTAAQLFCGIVGLAPH